MYSFENATNYQNTASNAIGFVFLCVSAGVLPRFLLLVLAKLAIMAKTTTST
jgi:hypothetical protein